MGSDTKTPTSRPRDRGDHIIMLLGEVKGEVRGISKAVDYLGAKVELQSAKLNRLPCDVHRKRISDLFKRAEGSARYITLESHRRQMVAACLRTLWRVGRVVVPALVAGGGIAAVFAALTGGCW